MTFSLLTPQRQPKPRRSCDADFDADRWPNLPSHDEAKVMIRDLGAPIHLVDRLAPAESRHVLFSLDMLFARTPARLVLRDFITREHPELNGKTAPDLFGQPKGAELIRTLVERRAPSRR